MLTARGVASPSEDPADEVHDGTVVLRQLFDAHPTPPHPVPTTPPFGHTRGRRRASSRHRVVRFAAFPAVFARVLAWITPTISILIALAGSAFAQLASPLGGRLPGGSASFLLAGGWAATAPDAMSGFTGWFAAPIAAWLQFGGLMRLTAALPGVSGPLAAAQVASVALTLVTVLLVWVLVRRWGGSALAAAVAALVVGATPLAVTLHAQALPVGVALPWLLVAAIAVAGRRPRAAGVGAAFATVAVLTEPLLVAALPAIAWYVFEAARRRHGLGAVRRAGVQALAGVAAVLVPVLVVLIALSLLPATGASHTLQALAAGAATRSPFQFAGAALRHIALVDPLQLVLTLVAAVVAWRYRRARAAVVGLALLVLLAVWPLGSDGAQTVLPAQVIAAVLIALAVDRGVVALGDPQLRRSVVGSGWLLAVVALFAISAVVAVQGLAQPRTTERAIADSASWVRARPASTVLVDLAAWPELQVRSGRTLGWVAADAGQPTVAESRLDRASALVLTPDSAAAADSTLAAVLARASTTTRFDGVLEASTITPAATTAPTSTAPTAAERRAAAARASIGAAVAANPRITMSAADRAALRRGAVDARVALVLVELAADQRVQVGGFPAVAGDSAAAPLRQVRISAVGTAHLPADAAATSATRTVLTALSGDYRVASVTTTSTGLLATFAADPTFIPNGWES